MPELTLRHEMDGSTWFVTATCQSFLGVCYFVEPLTISRVERYTLEGTPADAEMPVRAFLDALSQDGFTKLLTRFVEAAWAVLYRGSGLVLEGDGTTLLQADVDAFCEKVYASFRIPKEFLP